MKYYIAGRYERRGEFLSYAADLANYGHDISSKWLLGGCDKTDEGLCSTPIACAQSMIRDLKDSDIIVYFADSEKSRGRLVEWGIALGLGLKLVIIGDKRIETSFHQIPCEWHKTWQEYYTCVVSVSTTSIPMEQSVQDNSNPSVSTLYEQKSEPIVNTWTYPQRSYTDPQQ